MFNFEFNLVVILAQIQETQEEPHTKVTDDEAAPKLPDGPQAGQPEVWSSAVPV